MPTLNAAGVEIHYQVLGEPNAPAIVMIHGLMLGNMATWYFGAATALAKTHRVIVYDLRGHGMSSKATSGYDIATMVGDLKRLLDTLDIGEVSLVGHSYGALIALNFAKLYPDRTKKISMVEGPLPPARGLAVEEFLALSSEDMLGVLPDQLKVLLTSRNGKRMLERLQFLAGSTDLLDRLQNEDDIPDEELATLVMPVQLIYGSQSQLGDVALRLDKALPNAELHWLDGGHYLTSEKPLELDQALGGFFQ